DHARDPVRVSDQPADRQDAGHRGPPDAARARRRGDRITGRFAAPHESGSGPKQPIQDVRSTSALRGRSGLLILSSSGCDPIRTSPAGLLLLLWGGGECLPSLRIDLVHSYASNTLDRMISLALAIRWQISKPTCTRSPVFRQISARSLPQQDSAKGPKK